MRPRSPNPKTIAECLQWGSEQCHKVSSSPRLDAEILLMHILAKPRSYSRTWPDKKVLLEQLDAFKVIIQQRLKPTPVAYLLGHKEFWSRDFKVDSSTLIPRPETELLIEHSLAYLQLDNSHQSILDLGTGSGCIAITLQKECENTQVTAADISHQALKIAQQNAQQHHADIHFIQSSWFSAIPDQKFNLIVSNPPYIPINDEHLTQGDLPAEPLTALVSGANGLDDIKIITEQAMDYLVSGGQLIVEHGYDQKNSVFDLFAAANFIHIKQLNDLSNQARLTLGTKP